MKRVISTVIISLIWVPSLSARILNVPLDYTTIQSAIDASVDRDTVLVMPGVYHEHLIISGKDITLGSHYLVTDDTAYISTTIIDGDLTGVVISMSGLDSTAVLTGLTIRNGYTGYDGGALRLISSDPVIRDNIILNSRASRYGGGIFMTNSNPVIRENVIRGCYSFY